MRRFDATTRAFPRRRPRRTTHPAPTSGDHPPRPEAPDNSPRPPPRNPPGLSRFHRTLPLPDRQCGVPHRARGTHHRPCQGTSPSGVECSTEDSPRGLGRTLGKRVGGNPSRVRISYPPQPPARAYEGPGPITVRALRDLLSRFPVSARVGTTLPCRPVTTGDEQGPTAALRRGEWRDHPRKVRPALFTASAANSCLSSRSRSRRRGRPRLRRSCRSGCRSGCRSRPVCRVRGRG